MQPIERANGEPFALLCCLRTTPEPELALFANKGIAGVSFLFLLQAYHLKRAASGGERGSFESASIKHREGRTSSSSLIKLAWPDSVLKPQAQAR